MPSNMPNPTRRKGSDVYQIRCRVGGKLVAKSLGTSDLKEARRRLPLVHADLLAATPKKPVSDVPRSAPRLSIADACQRYRAYLLECETGHRREHTDGILRVANKHFLQVDHAKLAAEYRARVKRMLKEAHAKAIVRDFEHQEWWLDYLANSGVGEVEDRAGALMTLARTRVATFREIIASDELLEPTLVAPVDAPATAPLLSDVSERYIKERGGAMSKAVAADFRADVRDFCIIAGDKSVADYTKQDVRAYKDVLLKLPANWTKRKEVRHLGIIEAANKAAELKMPRQAAKTIKMKRARLSKVFAFAEGEYEGVKNPFTDNAAWVVADSSDADQRDAFRPEELKALLESDLPGHLYWLTWLGLCTGARLNELCQLTAGHVLDDAPGPRLYFSPELRLKTGEKKSCVRSVPLHPRLLSLGFLDYANACGDKNTGKMLFPGIPKRELTGRYSDAPSKDFGRHLKALGIKRPKLSFHSLRHTFAAEFKRRVPADIESRMRLMGQKVPGVGGRYGNNFEAEALDMELLKERAKILATLRF